MAETSEGHKKNGRIRLSKKAKIIILAVFVAVWAGMQIHQQLDYASNSSRGVIERMGDHIQAFIPLAGLTGAAIIGDINGMLQFAAGCAVNAGITFGLKEAIHAKRPNGGSHSFPSGHTSFAFQGAAFITRRYGWKFGIFAMLLACFVGYSRVEANKHWPRDVLAGAVIGIASSYAFTRPYNKKDLLKNITVAAKG